jgi:hypothetical protein
MFGYYEKGFRQKKFTGIYDVYRLANYIRNHPFKEKILELRTQQYKSEAYNNLKESLPSITVNGLFMDSKEISQFIQTSGFLYFDIDADSIPIEIRAYKNWLIDTYRQYIHMAGLSVGGKGLFFYLRVNGITVDNFDTVFKYYLKEVFSELPIDNNAKGIARNQIIPYDEQLYHNPECVLELPDVVSLAFNHICNSEAKKKATFSIKDKKERCYTLNVSFLPINQVLAKLKLETEFHVANDLFVIEPIDYYRVYFPNKIINGMKHKTFRAITQGLMYLNPGIELIYITSYLNYINQNHTTVPMKTKEMELPLNMNIIG